VTSEPLGSIVITREQRTGLSRDSLRSYVVFVDEVASGKIARGETLKIDVCPGEHVVRLKIDWTGSRPVHVKLPPGGQVFLVAGPTGTPLQGIRDLLPGREWCYLRVVSSGSGSAGHQDDEQA